MNTQIEIISDCLTRIEAENDPDHAKIIQGVQSTLQLSLQSPVNQQNFKEKLNQLILECQSYFKVAKTRMQLEIFSKLCKALFEIKKISKSNQIETTIIPIQQPTKMTMQEQPLIKQFDSYLIQHYETLIESTRKIISQNNMLTNLIYEQQAEQQKQEIQISSLKSEVSQLKAENQIIKQQIALQSQQSRQDIMQVKSVLNQIVMQNDLREQEELQIQGDVELLKGLFFDEAPAEPERKPQDDIKLVDNQNAQPEEQAEEAEEQEADPQPQTETKQAVKQPNEQQTTSQIKPSAVQNISKPVENRQEDENNPAETGEMGEQNQERNEKQLEVKPVKLRRRHREE